MPKAKFAHRNKPKPKSIKSRKVLNEKRLESRFGKKQLKGHAGVAVEYVSRTRAVKQLQVSIRDFRRLCILKGVFPRDPPHKRHLDARQTYYHHKDVAFLMHEPILNKFRQTKTFMKRFARAVVSSALEGQASFTEAFRMLGIRKSATFHEAARELGIAA